MENTQRRSFVKMGVASFSCGFRLGTVGKIGDIPFLTAGFRLGTVGKI